MLLVGGELGSGGALRALRYARRRWWLIGLDFGRAAIRSSDLCLAISISRWKGRMLAWTSRMSEAMDLSGPSISSACLWTVASFPIWPPTPFCFSALLFLGCGAPHMSMA
jgi:hypothetical protein